MTAHLEKYITTRYPNWVEFAQAKIISANIQLDAAEVVNDTLLRLIERSTEQLNTMAAIGNGTATDLSRYVCYAIKIAIISPRSAIRYTRGGYCTERVEWIEQMGASSGSGADYHAQDLAATNIDRAYELIPKILDSLDFSEEDKSAFLWRHFGRAYADYPDGRSKSTLSKIYIKIKKRIIPILRRQIGG
ncbi:MAG: hypothetical protein R3Y68_09015 [Rikenellaceae bacterium]